MKQYLKLLMAREAKEVLGRGGSNLWLLTLVLVATFASIAFSEGSMIYLKDRMQDPFTNWVSIAKAVNDDQFNEFRDSLNLEENKQKYDYRAVLMDQYTNYSMTGRDTTKSHYLSVRFFEHIKTPLVAAILDESNLVEGCKVDSSLLDDKTLGFIITMDAARRLGYDEQHLPSYINYMHGLRDEDMGDKSLIDSLGVRLTEGKFAPISVPVLAVVRRLPNNAEMMSASFFYEQQHYNDHTHPFNIIEHENNYLHQLVFYVSQDVDRAAFETCVKSAVPDSLSPQVLEDNEGYLTMKTWKPGNMLQVELGGSNLPVGVFNAVAQAVEKQFDAEQVRRVFRLETEEHPSPRSSFISVEFNSVKHIREFEAFAKEKGITLDMALVASTENFNAVTTMAGILSAAMVIFSIVCIIMFMVNMLQSYVQKVKRNIGTFKAFGMNGNELIQVYVIILVLIVLSGVVMALMITWAIQGMLPYLGVGKDGFNYLSLWNTTTYIATAVIFISTVATVVWVMTRMLSQTPGDLIYDRN